MINYVPFTTRQVEYLKKTFTHKYNVAEGGIRAGKNTLNIIAFAENVDTHPDELHLIFAVTKANAKMNIIDSNGYGLEHYFEGRCRPGTYKNVECLYVDDVKGNLKIICIIGGQDSVSQRIIKGWSLGSIYGTEANECHKTFVKQAINRTTSSHRQRIFFDLNPKHPKHWFYTEHLDFYDSEAKKGKKNFYNYEHFTMWDNLSMTNEMIRDALLGYDKTSIWYETDILGKRTAASGKIYTKFNLFNHVKSVEYLRSLKPCNFTIGIDVGGTDATVATLIGYPKDYGYVALLDGYYVKLGKDLGYDDALYAQEICAKIEEWIDIYPAVAQCIIFSECADPLFINALKKRLRRSELTSIQVVPSYKADGILDRIRLNCILIREHEKFFIAKHMTHWIEAYELAIWDNTKLAEGEWVRVDDGSYPVDCLDSTEYGFHPLKERLLKFLKEGRISHEESQ